MEFSKEKAGMTNRQTKRSKWFYSVLDELHFYKTKGEGIFKACAIFVSWGGGVNIPDFKDSMQLDSTIAVSFFLYSIAIIMEYIVQLVGEKRFIKKIIPVLMVTPSFIVFGVSICTLLQRPLAQIPIGPTYWCTIIPWIVIVIDVIVQCSIEKPETCVLVTQLQSIDVEG